jgi:hypothetical protein
VLDLVSNRLSPKHYRNSIHPIFSIIVHPIVQLIASTTGAGALAAFRILTSLTAGLWSGALFLCFRLLLLRTTDALWLTIFANVTAASLFFFIVGDTFPFGSMSLVASLLALTWSRQRLLPTWTFVAINLLTAGFSMTNWPTGLLVTFLANDARRTAGIIWRTALCFAVLIAAEKLIYPSYQVVPDLGDEVAFVNHPSAGGPKRILPAFIITTIIAPRITLTSEPAEYTSPQNSQLILSVQHSQPGSARPGGYLLVATWLLLLAVGLLALATSDNIERFVIATGTVAQLLLHLWYGEETFLYSLHFVPWLVTIVALPLRTRLRPVVISLMIIMTPWLAVNNLLARRDAIKLLATLHEPAHEQAPEHIRP